MSALTVNGVVLPVGIEDLKLTFEPVGSSRRNQRGHTVKTSIRNKWVFEFSLSPCPLDEAMLYKALICGEGEFWSTLTSVYGAKGLPLTGTGGWLGSGGGNPHNSNGVFRVTTGQTMVVIGKLYDQAAAGSSIASRAGATLIGWRRDDAAGTYRLFGFSWRALETTVTHKREKLGALGSSGAVQTFTGTETLAVSGGTLTLTAPGAGGPWRYSNMTLIPWFLPQAQVDQLLEGQALTTYTLPQLPTVYVTSDLLPTEQQVASPVGLNQAQVLCTGEVGELQVMPLARNGAFSTTECMLSGKLTEV